MQSPMRAAPSAAPTADGTVVMPAPLTTAADGTIVMQAPPAPAESTVLMNAPPAPRPPAPMAPPPAPPALPSAASMEGTVVMAAPAMPPPRPPEGRAALAPFATIRRRPSLPKPPRAGAPGKSGPIPLPPKPTATAAMPPIEPPRKKSGAPLALVGGGAGLLLLAALVGGAVWYVRNRGANVEPATTPRPASVTVAARHCPRPPPPAAVVKGSLRVESEPAGATVTLNGEAQGVTPLDVGDLFLGSHEVRVELRGYAPDTQTVELSADAPDVRAEGHAHARGARPWERPRSSRRRPARRSRSTAPAWGRRRC